MTKPEFCNRIAYSITPNNQPIVYKGKYYCKHCGNEVEPAITISVSPAWMHKANGDYILPDTNPNDDILTDCFRISLVCKDCTSTNVDIYHDNEFNKLAIICNKCGQRDSLYQSMPSEIYTSGKPSKQRTIKMTEHDISELERTVANPPMDEAE